MLYLAIDLGDQRTGLATGDDAIGLVTPVGVLTVPRGPRLLDALLGAIADHRPDALILGLPLNMDDSEGPQAKKVRAFGADLHARAGLPVHYQDERLTSYAADQQMARSGRTHRQKKNLRDALAAVHILEDFLRAPTPAPDEGDDP
ncbi:MAG: Holliday junction resolvase RuvX [Phycisphaerales bacterium]|nr:Holliday junction resolvase RuvX [Phycisphaerales bacterium]